MRSLMGAAHGKGGKPVPPNLIPNPHFIDNITGWAETVRTGIILNATGSVGFDGTQSYDDTGGSMKFTISGDGDPESMYAATLADHIAVTPGMAYAVQLRSKTDLDTSGSLVLAALFRTAFYAVDAADENDFISEDIQSAQILFGFPWEPTGGGPIPAPAESAYAIITTAIDWFGDAVVGGHVWIDNVSLTAAP